MAPDPHIRRDQTFEGLETVLHRFGGAFAVRVSHTNGRVIPEHSHDWPTLTIHVSGGCTEVQDDRTIRIAEPSATLLPAGLAHADEVDACGLETLGLVFDPAWLRLRGFAAPSDRPQHWCGGQEARSALRLSQAWRSPQACEASLQAATQTFFERVRRATPEPQPRWMAAVLDETYRDVRTSTLSVARRLNLNPAWLAQAYRAAAGEGLQETMRRRRVERASLLLKTTALSLTEIALAANFCDQAHMNRCFQAVLGVTPRRFRSGLTPEA